MKAATYLPTVLALLCGLWTAGCSSSAKEHRASGATLSVYASLPRHGTSARTAAAVSAGARLALADAGGRAGGRGVRLVELDSSKPGGETWDPSVVEANAKRAADDPATIAYLGELDEGASAISIPVTNDEGILQVSPLDGLTSLTRNEPGATLATGPARYYPSGMRTFLRLVPIDYDQASTLVGWARDRGARRLAFVQDERLFGRDLATQAHFAAAKLGMPVVDVVEAHDDPDTFQPIALRLAEKRPDAVIYTGLGDSAAGPLLATIARGLPGVPLYGGSALATAAPAPAGLPRTAVVKPALPAAAYGRRARRLLARIAGPRPGATDPEALYGYEAMRLILDAIDAAGSESGDRLAVTRAALAPRRRSSVLGPYRVVAGGDVSVTRFGSYRRTASSMAFLGPREPPPGER